MAKTGGNTPVKIFKTAVPLTAVSLNPAGKILPNFIISACF